MNKSKIFIVTAALLLSFVITACSEITGKETEKDVVSAENQNNAVSYTLKGKIKLNGAIPSKLTKKDSVARTATSTLDTEGISLTEDDFEIFANQISYDTDSSSSGGYSQPEIDLNDMSYSITLCALSRFEISCHLWDAFYGSVSFDLTQEMADSGIGPEIIMYPVANSTEKKGSFDLEFLDESGKIKSLVYKGRVLANDSSDTTVNNNSFETGNFVNFTSNKAGLELENIHPNSYEVTFTFTDKENGQGNTLYECKEVLVVFGGFTTDTWIGNGAHLRNNSRTGKTEFVITNSLINSFGTEVVPVSKVMMYGRQLNDEDSFNYYITDTETSSLPESVSFTNASNFDDGIGYAKNYSCFDSEGYYYVITTQESAATYITSNKPDFGTNGVYMTAFNIGNFFSIDRKTGDAYAYNPDYSSITKLTEDGNWLDGSQAPNFKLMDDDQAIRCDDVFAINDGVAYLTIVGESRSYFYVADLKTAIEDADGDLIVTVEQQSLPAPYANPRVTDMLYQDGYVYLLLRYDISSNLNLNFYSTGAVIRFNTFTKQFDNIVLGLADAIEHDDEAYVEVKGDASQKFYTNYPSEQNKKELVIKAKDIIDVLNLYSPKTTLSGSNLQLSTKAFYGPQKFIAVKPKKLVISDDGIAFYTDSEGLYKYKNVNRVVIVDLEKFSEENIEFESVATSLEFDFKENNASGYLEADASGSYWNFTLPSPIPVYTRDTKELYQNCIYCGEEQYMQNDSLKFFGETGDGGCGGRPLIRRED